MILIRTELISNTLTWLIVLVQWILGFVLDSEPLYQGTGRYRNFLFNP